MLTPHITTELNGDSDLWHLYATSYMKTEPAGERLFRSRPYPDVQFCHADEATANEHAARLQAYLDDCHSGKLRKTKKGAEEEVLTAQPTIDTSEAVWNL